MPESPMFSGSQMNLSHLRRIVSVDPEDTQLLIDTATVALPDALNVKRLKDGSGTIEELNLNIMGEHLPERSITGISQPGNSAIIETPNGSELKETMFGNVPKNLGLREGKQVTNSLLCDEITPIGSASIVKSEAIFGDSPSKQSVPDSGIDNIPFDMIFKLKEKKTL